MMTEPIIEVKNVWFSFNGEPVLSGVNLTVLPGDFLGVIGPNGGGKTTLLKLMLGLLQPDNGTVSIFGQPPARVAHRLGYVPQNVHINNTFPVSVLDVVLMGHLRKGKGWSHHTRQDHHTAQAALEQVGMLESRSCKIGELSGGIAAGVYRTGAGYQTGSAVSGRSHGQHRRPEPWRVL
jgi:zinc transport system ATP-binding protein